MVNQLLIAGHETTHVADHQLHVAAARGPSGPAGQRVVGRPGADPQRRRGEPALRPARARAVPHAERGHDHRRRRASRRGAKVMVLYASANRDEHRFPDRPDEFVVDRPLLETRKHYSFSWGIHHCLGAHLARLDGDASPSRSWPPGSRACELDGDTDPCRLAVPLGPQGAARQLVGRERRAMTELARHRPVRPGHVGLPVRRLRRAARRGSGVAASRAPACG